MFRHHLALSARPAGALALAVSCIVTLGFAGAPAHAAEATVDLGSAASFAVLGGQSVTNTGPSVVTGDLGVSPGTSVTGVPPLVLNGAQHVADAVADLAQSDLTTAYDSAAGRPTVTDVTGQDLGGMRLTSGVVQHTSGMQLTGTVTLDAQGDPAAVFIFKAGSTLTTASDSRVSLVNGASACNVFWQVGSSATLGTDTAFVGTIMALTSATLDTRASVQGRVLARNGSVTLDNNVITRPGCTSPAAPSGTPTVTPTPTAAPTVTPTSGSPTTSGSPSSSTSTGGSSSASPGGTTTSDQSAGGNTGGDTGENTGGDTAVDNAGNDTGTGNDSDTDLETTGGENGGPGGGATTPVVPEGHPGTGLGGGDSPPLGTGWMLLSLLGGTAVVGAAYSWKRTRPVRLH